MTDLRTLRSFFIAPFLTALRAALALAWLSLPAQNDELRRCPRHNDHGAACERDRLPHEHGKNCLHVMPTPPICLRAQHRARERGRIAAASEWPPPRCPSLYFPAEEGHRTNKRFAVSEKAEGRWQHVRCTRCVRERTRYHCESYRAVKEQERGCNENFPFDLLRPRVIASRSEVVASMMHAAPTAASLLVLFHSCCSGGAWHSRSEHRLQHTNVVGSHMLRQTYPHPTRDDGRDKSSVLGPK
jgi:hypothetical protein